MLRRILRSAAETGVREVHLINSFRVEKSFWQSPAVQPAALTETLLLGLEQGGDTLLPEVCCHRRFKPFVEDRLPGILAGQTSLLAQPGNHPPCPRGLRGDTVLVIGPEGGFIPYEVDKLQQAGCEPVSLGPRILRVETAIAFAMGRLT
jgi:RsmE family RNA methyltransferase